MSNEEKYISWLPNGLNNFWYKEFDEILDDYSKSKDQQIKELESLLEHASIVIDLKTDNTTFEKLRSEYQQKYPKQ